MNQPIIRKLEEKDFQKGFLNSLDILREASNITKEKALEILNETLPREFPRNSVPLSSRAAT